VGAITAGIALIVCRYLFLPLELSGILNAVFIGGDAGLAMSGFSQIKAAKRGGGERPMGLVLIAGVLGPAAVIAGFLLFGPPSAAENVEYVEYEYPGLTLELPDWTVLDAQQLAIGGWIEFEAPGGNGRFMKLNYHFGDPLPPESLLDAVGASAEYELEDERVVVRDGITFTTYALSMDGGKRSLMSHWACPQPGTSVSLITFLSWSWDELDQLQNRIIDSVTCSAVEPNLGLSPRIGLTPPPGFIDASEPGVQGYTTASEEEALMVLPTEVFEGVDAQALFTNMIQTAFEMEVRSAAPVAGDLLAGLSITEPVFRFEITDFEGPAQIVMTQLPCPDVGLGFLLLYWAPPGIPIEKALQSFSTATCPVN